MQTPIGEPMTLGSPQTPVSPSSHSQHQYLPPYLMGEQAVAVGSPTSSRLWSASSGSPPRSGPLNKSGNWGPGGGVTPGTQPSQALFSQTPRSDLRTSGRPNKEKPGAPPVHGLLESMHAVTPGSGRKAPVGLDVSQNVSIRQIPGGYTPLAGGFHTPGSTSTPSTPYSHTKKTPPSPAQVDPFYTQGESIRADDELNETWVTVFGFPPAATSYILQQFSQYGSIIKHVIASDGNWMHIHFQSKFQAKKALSKNGKVFGGSIMVGVSPCIDKSLMVTDNKENADMSYRTSFMGTPSQSTLLQQTGADKHNLSRNTPIRPLTAAYKAATSTHEVVSGSNTPQKNNGMINKAMEYVFGW